jgi:DNA-directed RNA polymerase beta' subunit
MVPRGSQETRNDQLPYIETGTGWVVLRTHFWADKGIRYKGVVCDRCGVEVTRAKVRRERMGHIKLATPVSHIWYFKGIPSRMGLILDISPRSLEKVLYFASYIVLDPGDTPLTKQQLMTETEYRQYLDMYGDKFRVGMGAAAVKELLQGLDLDQLDKQLRDELRDSSGQRRVRAILPPLRQQTGMDDYGCHPGHPAGTAPDGTARRRPLRYV